ncbi:transcriptional repressor [Pseudoduganella sp. FT25W]|jgi:Fur family ferric uptake transcriptional regulator|uniref:Transcriptional repressor n=1 Tax=Duganella alba TaxID=2666081 RepID=A0A6L5Q9B1_9BURK|nr:transcriptional repressor [Duganella alba]MRX06249.1 transcriptional repressor [Duganella alba]MRX14643.1 transcriptional repressor [Duganella alba]
MHTDIAESQIRATGARVTRQRVLVLDFLLGQNKSLTHHEIQARLARTAHEALDSVTLYRVLEWLTENELIHRIAGADQVWRFSAGAGHHAHEHAHFQCTKCEQVTCVTEVALPRKIKLPDGFQTQEIDFLIKGTCPNCSRKN